jgi:hypothetical protein
MKHFMTKLCITGGILFSGIVLSQSALDNELMLQPGESLLNTDWPSEFKDNPDDPDYLPTKTYGATFGEYYVYLPTSGITPYSKSSTAAYGGAGCIQRSSSSGYYDLQLQMPDGHEINGFRYYYSDSSASSSTAFLYTIDNTGTFSNELSITSTGDTGYGTIYASMPATTLVDNFNYRYGIRFSTGETGSNQKICGVRLWMDSNP